MITSVLFNINIYGQQATETKAPATPAGNASVSAAAAGLAQWKPWPDSGIHPDQVTVLEIGVDRTTGDLYVLAKPVKKSWGGSQAILKSTDQAKTFTKSKNEIAGSVNFSYAFNFDPAGKRMAFFLMYGSGGMSTDGGLNWTPFASVNPKDFDLGVVDWEDTGKTCLAICHESNPGFKLVISNDAGATWKELGDGYRGPVGIFDAKTLVAGKVGKDGGLLRSTDGGTTWTKVGGKVPQAFMQAIITFKGVGYLLTPDGLMVSKDKGANWDLAGTKADFRGPPPYKGTFSANGPFFGVDEKHIVVVGQGGVFQTDDGGSRWNQVAPCPEGYSSFAWDPVHNIVYACCRNMPPLYCQLPPLAKH